MPVSRQRSRLLHLLRCGVLLVAGCLGATLEGRPAAAADPWLFVNDVHFDPNSRHGLDELSGDTSPALLDSALAEMRRLAPDPPVIVMAGDFLSHFFKPPTAIPTMVALARRLGRTFPHAQFVLALGNEDSNCGDYSLPPDSAFLRAVATAWAPLVNRNGAAPGFARTFVHDGFYTTKLPLRGVRAVVIDDTFWSPFYTGGCGNHTDPTAGVFAELERALSPAGSERRWLVMHIPPGVDVDSTLERAHHLAIVPFMRPGPRDALLALVGDPARRIEVVVTGHVHRFGYRIVGSGGAHPVPLLIAPAISPIFGNSPSFLTTDVAPNGTVRNVQEHAFFDGSWHAAGSLASLGVSDFSGPALSELQHRLEHQSGLRSTFAKMYVGDSPIADGVVTNWRSYWCAVAEFESTPFRACLNEGGFGLLTRRGVVVVGAVIGLALAVVGALAAVVVFFFRRRPAR